MLVNGNQASLGEIFSTLISRNNRTIAMIEETSESSHFVGQIYTPSNSRIARLSFLLCDDLSATVGISALVEFLSFQAGECQAINLLAEVENNPDLFELLRHSGFSAYGIESVWKMPVCPDRGEKTSSWKKITEKDEIAIRSLYQAVTPPLEQGAELYQSNRPQRLLHQDSDEIDAWAQFTIGPLGIYVFLIMHPSIKSPRTFLADLSDYFSPYTRPVYLRIRSHQSWLNNALEIEGAQLVGEYTLMVKHLAIGQKTVVENGTRSRVKSPQTKPTIPILRNLSGEPPPIEPKNGLK